MHDACTKPSSNWNNPLRQPVDLENLKCKDTVKYPSNATKRKSTMPKKQDICLITLQHTRKFSTWHIKNSRFCIVNQLSNEYTPNLTSMYPDDRKRYLLTYSMEHSPSSEAYRFLASQQIPYIYGTRRFIAPFTSARHLSPSWARAIQSMPHILLNDDPS
jgi:hypothetical protein